GLLIATNQVNAAGPTYVSGPISADTTWYFGDSPYIVTGDVTVQPGFTLTIEPGVEVKFADAYSIIVDGTLIADGTSASKITFTSNKSSPSKGDWYAIRLRTDNNIVDHAEIGYASYGIFITFYGGNNTITNTTINYCKFDGIYITNSNYNTINNCTVSSNDRYGITLYESDHTDLVKSTIQYNHNFGVYLNASRYTQVKECNISYTDGKGILLYSDSHSTTISDSEICHNNHVGIDLSGASYNTIINSIIRWNNGTGIDFGGQTSNQWIENTIIMNNKDSGIDLKGSSNVNIIGCNISANKGLAGIFSWEAVSHISIFETEVWNNSGDGIWVYNGESMNIRDSKFIVNMGNGIQNKGGFAHQNNIIQNCIISENKRNGIYFECRERIQYNTIIDNTVSLNTQNGIWFHVFPDKDRSNNYIRDNIMDGNKVYSNGQRGIYFYLSPIHDSGPHHIINNNFLSNIIYSNYNEGIFLETRCSETNSFIQNNNIYSNIISNNDNGIFLYLSDSWPYSYLENNNIYANNISGNQIGVYFYSYSMFYAYIQNNNINSNNISNNQKGIYFYAWGRNEYSYIQNNYIYSNRIYHQDSGIYLDAVNPASSWQKSYIYNNTILSCGYGIMLSRMHSQFIYINNISNNNVGILLYKSSSNIIRYNRFSNNNWSGINLTSYSSNNLIENNVISMGNRTGIYIYGGSDGNSITRNSIENNSGIGVNITSATGNQIHHNNFINNTQNAYDSTISLNNWDDGVEGNYWSDYLGTDDDNDGFGEDPYVVPGEGSRDWHPFMYMVDISAPYIIITSPANGEIEVPLDTTISITFSKEMNKTAVEGAISISGGLTPTGFTWDSSNETVTFTPSSNLDSGAKYTVTITIDAMDILSNRLEKTYTFSFTAVDIEPPMITNTAPFDGETGVARNADVVVTFSEPMQVASINFTCTPDPGGWIISWEMNNTIAIFSHNDFGNEATYTFHITTGKDLAGLDLVSGPVPNPWTFSTPDVLGPVITSTTPVDGSQNVSVSVSIVVNFSEEIDISSVTYTCSPDPLGWSVVWTNNDKTATFSHNIFTEKTLYTFHISAAKDIPGNNLAPGPVPNPWSFTTTGDYTAPQITLTSPADNEFNVDPATDVIVTFNEVMDNSTLNYICIPDPGGWTVSWSGGNTIVTFSHAPFENATSYTFHINTVRDLSGNNIVPGPVPNPWSFATVGDLEPPQIISTSPEDNEIDVDPSRDVVVIFSEIMNTSTLNYSCNPDPGGWSESWSNGNTVATFSHNQFTIETTYTFYIDAGKDISGNDLVAGPVPNPWLFTTIGDLVAPEIISTLPANNDIDVGVDMNIIVTFNEAMDTSTILYICTPNLGGWSESWSNGNTVVTFSHNTFTVETEYTFHVYAGKDDSGNDLNPGPVPNPWSFTTVTGDLIGPEIISTSPANNEIDVDLDTNIIVTFNEAMDTSSLNYLCIPDPGGWSESWSNGDTVVTFTHDSLEIGTIINFYVITGKDISGNDLIPGAVPNPWSFTTSGGLVPLEITSASPADNEVDVGQNTNIEV
ncbi:MAG: Ig-like domain-containing protein, partial [Thermoplasmata archaeon]